MKDAHTLLRYIWYKKNLLFISSFNLFNWLCYVRYLVPKAFPNAQMSNWPNAVSIIYKHFHELLKRYEFAETVSKVMTLWLISFLHYILSNLARSGTADAFYSQSLHWLDYL